MNIGYFIKFKRERLGLSAEALGEKIGKNRATVYRYEKGDIDNLSIKILIPLASALEVTPADLLGLNNLGYTSTSLQADEENLLTDFRKLNATGKIKAAEYINDLTDTEKYTVLNNEDNLKT